MRTASLILVLALSVSASAQPLLMGHLEPSADTTLTPGAATAPYSFIDLAHPARVAGTVNNASLYWTGASGTCTAAFTLYFLRASGIAFGYDVIAKRGPFDATNGRVDVTLSPGVDVQPYDLLGITLDKPYSGCGTLYQKDVSYAASPTISTTTDLASGLGKLQIHTGVAMNVVATPSFQTTAQYIPAAGSTAGSFGAFFRTGVQLLNSSPAPIIGKLVFHPQGAPGSSSDPQTAFNLVPGQIAAYSDLVTQMGQSGVGSVDVITNGAATLTISARVFNDNGPNGTNGFYEEPTTVDDALQPYAIAYFVLPVDQANFRTNIGIRTLSSGATVSATIVTTTGQNVAHVTNTYAADFFDQRSLSNFFNITSYPNGAYAKFQVTAGAAIVYASVTDNRTNDTAEHIIKP